jgi:hypothetical protein
LKQLWCNWVCVLSNAQPIIHTNQIHHSFIHLRSIWIAEDCVHTWHARLQYLATPHRAQRANLRPVETAASLLGVDVVAVAVASDDDDAAVEAAAATAVAGPAAKDDAVIPHLAQHSSGSNAGVNGNGAS